MSRWARKGVRCRCIIGAGGWHDPCIPTKRIKGPATGDRLTVRSVRVEPHGVYINFDEWPGWWTFNVRAFRPIVEVTLEQDVERFAHHLEGSSAGAARHKPAPAATPA